MIYGRVPTQIMSLEAGRLRRETPGHKYMDTWMQFLFPFPISGQGRSFRSRSATHKNHGIGNGSKKTPGCATGKR